MIFQLTTLQKNALRILLENSQWYPYRSRGCATERPEQVFKWFASEEKLFRATGRSTVLYTYYVFEAYFAKHPVKLISEFAYKNKLEQNVEAERLFCEDFQIFLEKTNLLIANRIIPFKKDGAWYIKYDDAAKIEEQLRNFGGVATTL